MTILSIALLYTFSFFSSSAFLNYVKFWNSFWRRKKMISSHLIWKSEDVKKSRKEWLFKKETLMRAFEVFNKKVGMESDKQLKFSKSSFTLYYEIYVFNLLMSSFIDANRSLSHIFFAYIKEFFFFQKLLVFIFYL